MKKLFKLFFGFLGLEVRRKPPPVREYPYFRNDQMIQGLQRCVQRGIKVNTIVDVGAATGSWSLSAREFWPDANYILFEPLEERKAELEQICAGRKNHYFIPAAAGKGKSQVSFHVSGDLDGSGVLEEGSNSSSLRTVDVTSIEIETQNLKLKGPYIIKLDTHGFEVPIIEGCEGLLNDVALFIIECYGFHITHGSLLFWEMCRHMENKGFRLIDIIDVSHRSKDFAFWQCDAFFAPAGLDIFKDNSYS